MLVRTMTAFWPPPADDEYAPFYARYVRLAPDGPPVDVLAACLDDVVRLVSPLGDEQAGHRYAPGKWSVREVLGHVADAERVFAYRMVRFARGDATSLPAFDEQAWMASAGFDRRPLADLIAEFRAVRQATIALVGSLDEAAIAREGVASGHRVTVRALYRIIVGHERHHVGILRERYGLDT